MLPQSFTALITASMMWLLTGCAAHAITGEGPMKSTEYPLENVRSVSIEVPADVRLFQSDEERLVVHAQDNVLDVLVIDINRRSLDIDTVRGTDLRWGTELRFDVYVRDLDKLSFAGSVDFETDGFQTENLDVSISGSGDGELYNLDIGNLSFSSSGSSELEMSGEVDTLRIDSSGSSDVDAVELRARVVELDSSGSSDVRVWAVERILIDASGSTDLRYRGQPVIDQQSISGSATIRSLGN